MGTLNPTHSLVQCILPIQKLSFKSVDNFSGFPSRMQTHAHAHTNRADRITFLDLCQGQDEEGQIGLGKWTL